MSKKILIIAVGSYIGLCLARKLKSKFDVTGSYFNNEICESNICVFKFNLCDPECFNRLMQIENTFDCVIWSAQSSVYGQDIANYNDIFNVNLYGVQKTLEFCRVKKIKTFIYLSSGTVYKYTKENSGIFKEDSDIWLDSYYGFSKYAAEKICCHYSSDELQTIVLRLFTVYGPQQKDKLIARIWDRIENNIPVILNSGVGMYFTAIYIEDLVRIIEFFLTCGISGITEVINVANPEILSLRGLCYKIGSLLQKEVNIVSNDLPVNYSVADVTRLYNVIKDFNFTSIDAALELILNYK